MELADRKMALRVAATHGSKMAVELAMAVSALAERLGRDQAYLVQIDADAARRSIRAIRAELDDLDCLIDGREPQVPVAPRAA